jgi:hypothetical protein
MNLFAALSDEEEPPVTRLVNIRKKKDSIWYTCDVRIDRGSYWGNPFSHLRASAAKYLVATRKEAIESYRDYVLSRPDMMARLGELKGKTLGCWCVSKPWTFGDSPPEDYVCHGQILIQLMHGSAHTSSDWNETGRRKTEDGGSEEKEV